MKSMKTVLLVAVLGAVGYGAYVTIMRSPGSGGDSTQPLAWPSAQIPGPEAATPQFPSGPTAPQPGTAAPYSAGAAVPRYEGSGFAPPASVPVPVPARDGGVAAAYQSKPYPGPPEATNTADPAQLPHAHHENLALRSDNLPGTRAVPSGPYAADAMGASPRNKFATMIQAVQARLEEGRLAEAHLTLSRLYGDPKMPPAEAQQVTELLDQIGGTVIYSRRHFLEAPYIVKPGDTLEQIAETYNVPWKLLANVNGIGDRQVLQPGSELKVVRGPFNAIIDLDRYEMTLMLKGRYAGRFPIGAGLDYPDLEGSYVVCNKTSNPQYYGPDGVQIGADDPNNPYGEHWLGLGEQIGQVCRIGIHGTDNPINLHRTAGRGTIRMSENDVRDIHGILSIGSRVEIRRQSPQAGTAPVYPAPVDPPRGIL